MTQGNNRISERGFQKDLVMVMYQKPETLNKTNDQRLTAMNILWIGLFGQKA